MLLFMIKTASTIVTALPHFRRVAKLLSRRHANDAAAPSDDDDDDGNTSDVTEKDLGDYLNQAQQIHEKVTLGIWTFVKSLIVVVMSIVSVVVAATIHIVPQIFGMLSDVINLITQQQMPDQPNQIQSDPLLVFANTFFPIDILFSSLTTYYALYFSLLFVRVSCAIARFGLSVTVKAIRVLF